MNAWTMIHLRDEDTILAEKRSTGRATLRQISLTIEQASTDCPGSLTVFVSSRLQALRLYTAAQEILSRFEQQAEIEKRAAR